MASIDDKLDQLINYYETASVETTIPRGGKGTFKLGKEYPNLVRLRYYDNGTERRRTVELELDPKVLVVKKEKKPRENVVNPGLSETNTRRRETFGEAYLEAGGGRPYVYIHKIRELLKWPRKEFDDFLNYLSKEGLYVLQGGNPENLTEKEKADSYMDKLGYLRMTISVIK